jgi:hypothetical protein
LVQNFERVRRVEPAAAGIGDDVVVVNDLVESLAKLRAGLAFGGGVIAGRRVRSGRSRANEQHAANKQ